jgi:hypothetical protein
LNVKSFADRLAAVEQRPLPLPSMPSPLYYYSKCCTVNSVIRRGKPDPVAIEEMRSIVRCLDQLAPHPGRCFRGLDLDDFPDAWLCQTFIPGGVYCDVGFTSASIKWEVAWHHASAQTKGRDGPDRRLVMVIYHSSGRYINDFVAEEFKWEEEMLFKPNTRFLIESVDHSKPDHVLVYAKEIVS